MSQSYKELFELKKASLELLEQRGFNVERDKWLLSKEYVDNIEEFKRIYKEILPTMKNDKVIQFFNEEKFDPNINFRQYISTYYPPKGDDNYDNPEGVVIYFASGDGKKVSKEDVIYFCRMIEYFGVSNGIIVSKNPLPSNVEGICTDFIPTRSCKKNDAGKYGCFIQHYLDEELHFNPLKHYMVPKHRILSLEEADALKPYVNKRQFPLISALDIIAKRLGARPDDVIEVTRKSMISDSLIEEEFAYRYVVVPQKSKKK